MENVKEEWRHGSKNRVIKYYAMGAGIAVVIGVVVGVVIWALKRYA